MGEPADTAVPVLWLLLRPSRLGPPSELPAKELGAPLQVLLLAQFCMLVSLGKTCIFLRHLPQDPAGTLHDSLTKTHILGAFLSILEMRLCFGTSANLM